MWPTMLGVQPVALYEDWDQYLVLAMRSMLLKAELAVDVAELLDIVADNVQKAHLSQEKVMVAAERNTNKPMFDVPEQYQSVVVLLV